MIFSLFGDSIFILAPVIIPSTISTTATVSVVVCPPQPSVQLLEGDTTLSGTPSPCRWSRYPPCIETQRLA